MKKFVFGSGCFFASAWSPQDIVSLPWKSKVFMIFFVKIPTIMIEIGLLIAGMSLGGASVYWQVGLAGKVFNYHVIVI